MIQSRLPVQPFVAPEIYSLQKENLNSLLSRPDMTRKNKVELLTEFKETFSIWSGHPRECHFLYPVNGSTEAITHCMYELSLNKHQWPLHILPNEYSWYASLAASLRVPIKIITESKHLEAQGTFVISAPFCRDGNISHHNQQLMQSALDKNISLWIDCAYFGTTTHIDVPFRERATHTFYSFSKQFGLAQLRFGLWASKRLYRDREILNSIPYLPFGKMLLSISLMEKFRPDWLFSNYKSVQRKITKTPADIVYFCKSSGCITKKMNTVINRAEP